MIRILFVCHGNICRSPMAESVCAEMIRRRGWERFVAVSSAAAHTDEIGNPPHRGTREKLTREGIPLVPHRAVLMTALDGEKYDYLIGMDAANVRDMKRIVAPKGEGKVCRLLDYASSPRSIADPWYTGDFEQTYEDVVEGCAALLDRLAPDVEKLRRETADDKR